MNVNGDQEVGFWLVEGKRNVVGIIFDDYLETAYVPLDELVKRIEELQQESKETEKANHE